MSVITSPTTTATTTAATTPGTSTPSSTTSANPEDYSSALKALRVISHAVACKAVGEVAHNQWMVAGLERSGITAKKVNDRIKYVKSMVSALNRAECADFECRTSGNNAFAMANGATFSHVNSNRKALKQGWNQGASRAGGRDKKAMMAEAFYGDYDLECDRLYTDRNGDVRTVT